MLRYYTLRQSIVSNERVEKILVFKGKDLGVYRNGPKAIRKRALIQRMNKQNLSTNQITRRWYKNLGNLKFYHIEIAEDASSLLKDLN